MGLFKRQAKLHKIIHTNDVMYKKCLNYYYYTKHVICK